MGKFCRYCGAPLSLTAKFCTGCGAKIDLGGVPPEPSDTSPSGEDAAETTTEAAAPTAGVALLSKQVVQHVAPLLGNTMFAPSGAGEIQFTSPPSAAGGIMAAVGPFKCLVQGFLGIASGVKTVIRDKRRWIPAAALAVVWLVLILMPALGLNPVPLRFLSFLTFARGGVSGGLVGLIGGVAGKGVFAYFLTSLLLPLTRGQRPFSGIGGGLSRLRTAFGTKEPVQLSALFAGLGAALFAYNAMAGTVSLSSGMGAVAAFVLSLRALAGRPGFLRRFIGSVSVMLRQDKHVDPKLVTRLTAGWTAGFALSLPMSLIPLAFIGYMTGILGIVAAIVLKIVSASQKEAVI